MIAPKLRVAVLRGGPSDEFEVSLKTGEHILSILREMENRYEPEDIFISRDGVWHRRGLPIEPHAALSNTDFAWNAMHGSYGEDGEVQRLLEKLKVPYNGSGILGSALAMQKDLAKQAYKRAGLTTADWLVIEEGEDYEPKLATVFRSFVFPVVIKPAGSGSSVGVKLAHSLDELRQAVSEGLSKFKKLIIEQFVKGKEATAAVLENARGEKLYALIPVEIERPKGALLWDYASKYSPQTIEKCPGTFSQAESKKIEEMAKRAHEALGLRHYSRSDFIVTPRGNVYILETNSLPGFSKESLLPKALKATGWKPAEFVEHVINLGL